MNWSNFILLRLRNTHRREESIDLMENAYWKHWKVWKWGVRNFWSLAAAAEDWFLILTKHGKGSFPIRASIFLLGCWSMRRKPILDVSLSVARWRVSLKDVSRSRLMQWWRVRAFSISREQKQDWQWWRMPIEHSVMRDYSWWRIEHFRSGFWESIGRSCFSLVWRLFLP